MPSDHLADERDDEFRVGARIVNAMMQRSLLGRLGSLRLAAGRIDQRRRGVRSDAATARRKSRQNAGGPRSSSFSGSSASRGARRSSSCCPSRRSTRDERDPRAPCDVLRPVDVEDGVLDRALHERVGEALLQHEHRVGFFVCRPSCAHTASTPSVEREEDRGKPNGAGRAGRLGELDVLPRALARGERTRAISSSRRSRRASPRASSPRRSAATDLFIGVDVVSEAVVDLHYDHFRS